MADYHLQCLECRFETPEDRYYVSCPRCEGVIEVVLDNPAAERIVDTAKPSIFKYHNLMPYPASEELFAYEDCEDTPEVIDRKISEVLDVELIVKNEMTMPTGTWKDREGFVSIHRLLRNRVDDLMVFSSGNTGTSLARTASRVKGPRLHLVVPEASKTRLSGVRTFYDPAYVDVRYFAGSNDECVEEAKRIASRERYPIEGGFTNYARREGLKLLGLEHLRSGHPGIDWYVQPVAGGIGLYAFDKACSDSGVATPRLLGVQAEICDPMVRAWRDGASRLEQRHIPDTVVPSPFVRVLRTRNPGNAYGVLKQILDRCSGAFESVSDQQILEGLRLFYASDYFRELYHRDGTIVGLEPATALAGVAKAIRAKTIARGSRVLLNVSGAAKQGDVELSWIGDLL